jgi:hypothetical protein
MFLQPQVTCSQLLWQEGDHILTNQNVKQCHAMHQPVPWHQLREECRLSCVNMAAVQCASPQNASILLWLPA